MGIYVLRTFYAFYQTNEKKNIKKKLAVVGVIFNDRNTISTLSNL